MCFHLVGLCSRASLPVWTESSELLVVVLKLCIKKIISHTSLGETKGVAVI